MLVQSDSDPITPFEHTEELATRYATVGAHAEIVRVVGAGHMFGPEETERLTRAGIDFFRIIHANRVQPCQAGTGATFLNGSCDVRIGSPR